MALIEYRIDLDNNGNAKIVTSVKRLDPGDEIHLASATPNAALQWNTVSPFLPPAPEKVHMLRQPAHPPQPLQPAGQVDMSKALAECGVIDTDGSFKSWVTSGAGFPDTSKPP